MIKTRKFSRTRNYKQDEKTRAVKKRRKHRAFFRRVRKMRGLP